jgi:hypothetical protein
MKKITIVAAIMVFALSAAPVMGAESQNHGRLPLPMEAKAPQLQIGDVVSLSEGETYYESSIGGGSGRQGVITDDNSYFKPGQPVVIDGYAWLGEGAQGLEEHAYIRQLNGPLPTINYNLCRANFVSFHFRSQDGIDGGWLAARSVIWP